MKTNDGGPAFPGGVNSVYTNIEAGEPTQPGMTLRDYFAAKALPAIYTTAIEEAAEGSGLFNDSEWRTCLALDAYLMADAMLAACGVKK